jgi:hypothetical protein
VVRDRLIKKGLIYSPQLCGSQVYGSAVRELHAPLVCCVPASRQGIRQSRTSRSATGARENAGEAGGVKGDRGR